MSTTFLQRKSLPRYLQNAQNNYFHGRHGSPPRLFPLIFCGRAGSLVNHLSVHLFTNISVRWVLQKSPTHKGINYHKYPPHTQYSTSHHYVFFFFFIIFSVWRKTHWFVLISTASCPRTLSSVSLCSWVLALLHSQGNRYTKRQLLRRRHISKNYVPCRRPLLAVSFIY